MYHMLTVSQFPVFKGAGLEPGSPPSRKPIRVKIAPNMYINVIQEVEKHIKLTTTAKKFQTIRYYIIFYNND